MYVKFTNRMDTYSRAIEWDRVEGRAVTVHLESGDRVPGVALRSEWPGEPLSNVLRLEAPSAGFVRRIPTHHVKGFTLG